MRSEGYSSCSARKLGRNVLHDGGERERKEGEKGKEGGGKKEVKVQFREGNSNFVHEWVKFY